MTSFGSDIPAKTLFLDIEATGRHPPRDALVEIAIVDDEGRTVLNTLVNPLRPIANAKTALGITEEMVASAPPLRELWPTIEAIVFGCHVVTYNAEHDAQFFPRRLEAAGHISCAMKRFAPIYGRYDHFHNDYRWVKLKTAADYIGYEWVGMPHRALPDALACRAIWRWMEDRQDFPEPMPTAWRPRPSKPAKLVEADLLAAVAGR
jgi:DNA polymerase III subunit epsilon